MSDLSICSDLDKLHCEENWGILDCGQLESSPKYKNYGCMEYNAELLDSFSCSNRMDKATVMFGDNPPVPKTKKFEAINYNKVLSYNKSHINCGNFSFTYEEFHDVKDNNLDANCYLSGDITVTLDRLWYDLLTDFTFEMSPTMDLF